MSGPSTCLNSGHSLRSSVIPETERDREGLSRDLIGRLGVESGDEVLLDGTLFPNVRPNNVLYPNPLTHLILFLSPFRLCFPVGPPPVTTPVHLEPKGPEKPPRYTLLRQVILKDVTTLTRDTTSYKTDDRCTLIIHELYTQEII